jgi:hypothetical protein
MRSVRVKILIEETDIKGDDGFVYDKSVASVENETSYPFEDFVADKHDDDFLNDIRNRARALRRVFCGKPADFDPGY